MEPIIIYLCEFPNKIKTFNLNSSNKINILNKGNKTLKDIFYFKGIILNINFTFQFYNIKNNDFIISIPNYIKKQMGNDQKFINKLSQIYEIFQEKLIWVTNKNTINEFYRLKDLQLLKFEGKQYIHKKYFSSKLLKGKKKVNNSIEMIIPEKLSTIPDTPLPIFWALNSEQPPNTSQSVSNYKENMLNLNLEITKI